MQSPRATLPGSSLEGLKAAVVDALGLLEAVSVQMFRAAVVRALAQAAWDELAAETQPVDSASLDDLQSAARRAGVRLNTACERILVRVRQLALRASLTPWDGAAEALRHVSLPHRECSTTAYSYAHNRRHPPAGAMGRSRDDQLSTTDRLAVGCRFDHACTPTAGASVRIQGLCKGQAQGPCFRRPSLAV